MISTHNETISAYTRSWSRNFQFFFIFSGFTQLILSLLLITFYISIISPLTRLCFKVVSHLFSLSSYLSYSNSMGILVALLFTLSILSMSPSKLGFHACTAYCKCGIPWKHKNLSKVRDPYSQTFS